MLGFTHHVSSPLVLQLQESAMDGAVKVSTLLNKAKAAASKLKLSDMLDWLACEANGYGTHPIPAYRTLPATPKLINPFNGLIPIMADHRTMKELSKVNISQSVSELEGLLPATPGTLKVNFHPRMQAFVNDNMDLPVAMQGCWVIGSNQIEGILTNVRNKILDWSLQLETAGVTGEGLTFSANEKAAAMSVTNNFHHSSVGVLGNVGDYANVRNILSQSEHSFNSDDLTDVLGQINAARHLLPAALQNEIDGSLASIQAETKSGETNSSKIAEALKSIRTVCEGTTGNLVASGIGTLIGKLLGA